MKKIVCFLLTVGISVFGYVTVTSPNGGEVLTRGGIHEVTWDDDLSENVKIELFQNGEYNSDIVSSTPSNGSYLWNLNHELDGSGFQVKISSTVMPALHTDMSDGPFVIERELGVINILTPDGGEAFERGSKTVISWYDNISEEVKIELYRDDLFYSTIVDTTESDGSYEWTIPVDLFGLFKVKISSVKWSDTYGISQNTFEIKKGSITISSPQGGDVLQMFEEKPIIWTDDFPEDVKISLIKNTELLTELSSKSNGLRNWNFYTNDLTAGSDYRLRIESKLFDDVYAETGNFSIKGTNNVKGSVSGNWTEENSPYILTDSTFVESTSSLMVNPNVSIKGSRSRINFNIFGTIEAIGSYDRMIEFDGILLNFNNSASADTSNIQFANFTQNNNQGLFDGYKIFGGGGSEFSNSVKQVTDGGFIFTGYTTSSSAGDMDVWLVKTDSYGNLEWSKIFGGFDDDVGRSVAETKDGGFIITGYTRSFGYGQSDLWLIKTDAFGNHEWDHTFGGSGNDGGQSVKETVDSGFIITGYTKSFGAGLSDLWLIKTDAFGNQEWSYTFGGTKDDIGYDVEITTDGGYIVSGNTFSFSTNLSDVWVVKTSSDGIEEWSRTYGNSYQNFGYSIQQTRDGGFIVGGTAEPGVPEPLLLKIKENGDLLWLESFPCGYGHGHRACEAADGGYLLVGQNQDTMFLAKTDVDGEMLWEKSIKETAHNYIGFSLERTYDGGFIIVGTKSTYDVFLVKTDADGNTSDTIQTISIDNNSKAVIQNCIINNINNYGITVNNASPVISNNLIIQNKGGIKFTNSSPQYVVNNTIADNDSIGLYFDGNSEGQFVNNIIYGNKIKEVYINDDQSNPAFYYNNIKGGQAQFGLNSGVTYTGPYANNISSDPFFSSGAYYLSTTSPCIDAGYPGLTDQLLGTLYIPQTDILGNQRIFGSEIDMGCYEWNESGIEEDNIIDKLILFQNYPNPFNPETIIKYSLVSECHVKLKIYNLAGKEVATLVDKRQNKGIFEVNFKGDSFSSGMYFYKLSVDSRTIDTKKMLLLR